MEFASSGGLGAGHGVTVAVASGCGAFFLLQFLFRFFDGFERDEDIEWWAWYSRLSRCVAATGRSSGHKGRP
eukprot:scaffold133017_cov47-Attheya_sp.AAC.1